MKSELLKQGDKVLITQGFIEQMSKLNPQYNKTIWRLGEIATVDTLSEFSTVRIYRGLWNTWVTNSLAEEMHVDYLAKLKGFAV